MLQQGRVFKEVDQYLDLICRVGSKEHDLCKVSMRERSIADATNDLITEFYDGQALGVGVEDESRDVLSGHLWELFLKERLQPCEDDA